MKGEQQATLTARYLQGWSRWRVAQAARHGGSEGTTLTAALQLTHCNGITGGGPGGNTLPDACWLQTQRTLGQVGTRPPQWATLETFQVSSCNGVHDDRSGPGPFRQVNDAFLSLTWASTSAGRWSAVLNLDWAWSPGRSSCCALPRRNKMDKAAACGLGLRTSRIKHIDISEVIWTDQYGYLRCLF